jgi:hypothetical protein
MRRQLSVALYKYFKVIRKFNNFTDVMKFVKRIYISPSLDNKTNEPIIKT